MLRDNYITFFKNKTDFLSKGDDFVVVVVDN